ncbi:MAG: beta-N-acetylhexosaminidase [Candidatus Marinimicrobia bacterium]|nr:beta-N-acetylhexosaminidase [Candidatus Neomarinimicrobiota bacterium]
MNIIPKPHSIVLTDGAYVFKERSTLSITGSVSNRLFIEEYLGTLIPGLNLIDDESADIKIKLHASAGIPPEGYVMKITRSGILITAGDTPGVFYGIQSLRQLLPVFVENQEKSLVGHRIQTAVIQDYPRFGWRGMHLDVSRHFFPVEFIKRYIDMIALHKMNVFHWHLTDDNGWRLEIKQYPKLTEICAWRVDREHQDWRKWSPVEAGEKSTYGGFYTQEEVRDVIAYAAERQIAVIPEIEMPGHSSEIFAAYPELSCKGELLPVRPGSYWPNEDILCAGNDSVFIFLERVIDEVAELFPAEYIHIGGDEAAKTHWKTCPKCQARIKAEALADEHELQSWFIRKMEKYIHSKGKRIIGWDEILEGGLAPDATVMSWRGEAGGIAAAKAGHQVIMTPSSHVYFDHYQGDPETEPQAIGGYTPLKEVYAYEPIPMELEQIEHQYVLGAQANLWTEFVKTTKHAEYMVLPRMTALSEVLWSAPEQRNWSDFMERLTYLEVRFDALNWNYRSNSLPVE